VPEDLSCGGDQRGRCGRVAQVGGDVLDAATLSAQLVHERLRSTDIGAPRLLGVVGHPGVQQDCCTFSDRTSSDGRSDRDATARTSHDHDAVLQTHHRHQPMIAEAAAGSHPDSAMDMCPRLDVARYERMRAPDASLRR
jgi:hypothetical protein